MKLFTRIAVAASAVVALSAFHTRTAVAEDWPMWGRAPNRLMVTPEKGVPMDWDVESGKNIKWVATIGSQSYGNPVVAGGLVTIGTNNESHKDPKVVGDASCELIFDEQ